MPCFTSRFWAALFALLLMFNTPVTWALPPDTAPPPLGLLSSLSPVAQMDDPELVRELSEEETLADLQNIEYERDALSVSRGITLSLIPGGGWSMIYANRTAQGILVIASALVGYGFAAAHLMGAYDEKTVPPCQLTAFDLQQGAPSSVLVASEFCQPASPIHPFKSMPDGEHYIDRNLLRDNTASAERRFILSQAEPPSGYMQPRFNETSTYYTTLGTPEDNADEMRTRGLIILASTYVVSTALAAVWSSIEISDQNDELRKRIESTAQGPSPQHNQPSVVSQVKPTFQFDGQQTVMGLGGHF